MLKVNKELEKINANSLAKIIVYEPPIESFINSLDFYNLVLAKSGLYVVLKNELGATFDLLQNIKCANPSLNDLGFTSIFYTFLPKPKLQLFNEILEMFKYVCNQTNWELCVNVYYDLKNKEFKLSLDKQIISGAAADYKYSEEYEMSKNYVRYLQIHSHNTMTATFSSKDNNDENFTALCYYGVVGKLTSESKFFNVDMKFRVWNGIRFIDADLDSVFELNLPSCTLSSEMKNKLDKIIKVSKKIAEKNFSTLNPLMNNNFTNIESNLDIEFLRGLELDDEHDYRSFL